MSALPPRPKTGGATVLFRSCKRCTGDRSLEWDYDGWYIICLMCGHVSYPDVGLQRMRARVRQSVTA